MEITHEYDSETQKLIDDINNYIITISEQYESILNPKTAKGCIELYRPGYRESIIREYNELVKPYREKLEKIYLESVPRIIIKKISP